MNHIDIHYDESCLPYTAANLEPLYAMTPEQRRLLREYIGVEESLLSAQIDTLSRELSDLKKEVKNLGDELHGKIEKVEDELSDTQKTNLVQKLEESQRELDRTRRKLGMKERKSDAWRDWAWKIVLAIALGMAARHVLGVLFPSVIGH